MTDLTFEPPGPGTWNLNDLHFPRPLTRYNQDLPFGLESEGASQGLAKYGALFDMEVAVVNRFQYSSRRLVDGTPDSQNMPATIDEIPPEPENEFQRRVLNAKETFDTKRWRRDLERWDTKWKPALEETNRSLGDVTPADLDDEDLIQHLDTCREAVLEHGSIIFRILPCAWIPQNDFLAFVREHTELPPAEVTPLFAGATPDSLGAIDELNTLATAIEATPDARELVFSDDSPGRIINQLKTFGDGIGDATEDWLSVVGFRRISGFDLDGNYGLERPATLLSTLRSALTADLDSQLEHDPSEALEEVRQKIPAELRDSFDERYEEARLTYRVQDERALRASATIGLLRRALLDAGRRLAEQGQLRDSEHVVDMQHNEIIDALRGNPSMSAAEVAAHVRYRQTHDASDAPAQIGSDQSLSLDPEKLPESAARVAKAFEARGWANQSETEPDDADEDVITGHGASSGTVEGTARIVSGPEDFDNLRDGDILVAEITGPSVNVVLPMLGGIVTDTGGMLSHPAIVAREFDIPGVVGCEDATDRIQDGERVVVNGKEGTVRTVP